MNKKCTLIVLALCLIAAIAPLKSQNKYWVMFNNKTGTPYTIANPSMFLTPKSILRRVTYNVTVNSSDLPVTPAYVSQVAGVSGVTVLYASKWLNAVVVSIPPASASSALSAINAFTFVSTSNLVNRYRVNVPITQTLSTILEPQQTLRTANTNSFAMGGSYWQNKQINVTCLHEQGYRGNNMLIGVMDVGFYKVDTNPLFDSLRNRGGIIGTRDFVAGGNSVYEDPEHGANVLSCMAAVKPNVIMGSAPMADYWLFRTEDGGSESISEEYNWVRAAEFADSVGVDILTTSLGYTEFDKSSQNHTYATLNGRTAPMSIASTMAARKGIFVLTAAGNDGQSSWHFIGVPGDADSVCTVGAIDTLYNYASFSSVGPTADGRIKPDLVARGLNTWLAYSSGVAFQGSGTSFATPVLAGGIACYWQAHRNQDNITLLKTIKNSASNRGKPNNNIGWGWPDLCAYVPVGIKENKLNIGADVSVSPNPFNALLTVNLEQLNSNIISLQIYDVLGKIVGTSDVSSKTFIINTENYPEGIYVIKINTEQGTVTKKIIKQQ